MKIALTLLLVGIAQSQTLLNTLRNLGAADSSQKDSIYGTNITPPTYIHNLPQVHTGNIVILLESQKKSQEEKKTIDAQADESKKLIDTKTAEDIDARVEAIQAKANEDIKATKQAKNVKANKDKKAIDVQSAAKKKKIDERERNNQSNLLQELLMQKPKGIPGLTPSDHALDTFKKLGGLNYQELVADNIIEEPSQPVTIKLNFKSDFYRNHCFEFAQVNSDDQLHGFARYITSDGRVYEQEYRNDLLSGFARQILNKRSSKYGDYYISWEDFGAELSYLTGNHTPQSEATHIQLKPRNHEAFEIIKNFGGPSNYFMNQGNI